MPTTNKSTKSDTSLPSPSLRVLRKQARDASRIRFSKPSRTRQSEKDDCNINNIMAKYERTGLVTHINVNQGQYGDFSNLGTYQEAMNQIMLAQNMFETLPADLRKQFNNDPEQFVTYADDPENNESMIKMGLRLPPEPSKDIKPKKPDEGISKDETPLSEDPKTS